MADPKLTNQVYKDLNKSIKMCMKDLTTTFPEIDQLKLLSASFYVMKKLNKKLPYKYFHEYVYEPYSIQLQNKDEDFFLSDRFQSTFWQSFVDMIKTTWRSIETHNKEAIWLHMHNIVHKHKLCIKYKQSKLANSDDEA